MVSKGRLQEAFDLLNKNRKKLSTASVEDASVLTVRLMSLMRLADVSKSLGQADVLRDALHEWVSVWEEACRRNPDVAKVESLARCERWVRAAQAEAPNGR